MKRILRQLIACASILATLNLTVATSRAATPSTTNSSPAHISAATPKIVSATTLSTQELARYQQKSAQSQTATHDQAAGAADNKTVWIVVGVVAAIGVIALVASGGGGGGGGGY